MMCEYPVLSPSPCPVCGTERVWSIIDMCNDDLELISTFVPFCPNWGKHPAGGGSRSMRRYNGIGR